MLAASTTVSVERKRNRPLLVQGRKHKMMKEILRKGSLPEAAVFVEGEIKKAYRHYFVRRECESLDWLLASTRMSKLQIWIGMQIRRKVRIQARWGWQSAWQKAEEKWCERISCLHERSLHNCVVCLKILIREDIFHGRLENGDQITPSSFPMAPVTKLKFGKERESLRAKIQGKNTRQNLAARKMRPQSSIELGEKCLQAQKQG